MSTAASRKKIGLYLIALVLSIAVALISNGLPRAAQSGLRFFCVCFLALVAASRAYTRDGRTLALAMLFTCFADAYMLLSDEAAGVLIFIIVQALHLTRQTRRGRRAVLALAAAPITAVFLWLLGLRLLIAAGAVYAALIFANLTLAIVNADRKRWEFRHVTIAAGFALFALCDVSVALTGLAPYHVAVVTAALTWLFYLPSQLLLALSAAVEQSG